MPHAGLKLCVEKYPTFQPTKPHYRTKNRNVDVCGVFGMNLKNAVVSSKRQEVPLKVSLSTRGDNVM